MAAGAVADVADALFPVFRQYRGRAMLMAAETGVAAEVAAGGSSYGFPACWNHGILDPVESFPDIAGPIHLTGKMSHVTEKSASE